MVILQSMDLEVTGPRIVATGVFLGFQTLGTNYFMRLLFEASFNCLTHIFPYEFKGVIIIILY